MNSQYIYEKIPAASWTVNSMIEPLLEKKHDSDVDLVTQQLAKQSLSESSTNSDVDSVTRQLANQSFSKRTISRGKENRAGTPIPRTSPLSAINKKTLPTLHKPFVPSPLRLSQRPREEINRNYEMAAMAMFREGNFYGAANLASSIDCEDSENTVLQLIFKAWVKEDANLALNHPAFKDKNEFSARRAGEELIAQNDNPKTMGFIVAIQDDSLKNDLLSLFCEKLMGQGKFEEASFAAEQITNQTRKYVAMARIGDARVNYPYAALMA